MKLYKFGVIMLILREEYLSYKCILERLSKCVKVDSSSNNHYFDCSLSSDKNDASINLYVEKECNKLLNDFNNFKSNSYSYYVNNAIYNAKKNDDGMYLLNFKKEGSCLGSKRYIPEVQVIDMDTFSNLVDELLSTDLMNLKSSSSVGLNNDFFSYNFGQFNINSSVGYKSRIYWNGIDDTLKYSISYDACFGMIDEILNFVIPECLIPDDLLKILEKHENKFNDNISFSEDIRANRKYDVLNISDIYNIHNKTYVRLKQKKQII